VLGWDRRLERWVVGHRVGFLDPVAKGLSWAGGRSLVWLALAALVAALLRRPRVLVATLAAAVLAELSSDALKAATGRDRPDVPRLLPLPHSSSFPSGHAATSFACATVLGAAVPRWRVPLYLLATLVAWSRAYVGVHYPLDVVAGAALGLAVGWAVLRAPRMLAAARRSRPRSTRTD
jgi:membrane-associated phospholipid phosphatase